MSANIVEIKKQGSLPICSGLISLTGYEPWPPRFIAGVKQAVQDDHPVIIRLHGAAEYPSETIDRYAIDLESHAVMIVGFDDARAAFEIIDPWNNKFGGSNGGKRWLSYETAALTIVDASLGMMMIGSPPIINIQSSIDESGNTSLALDIRFYIPDAHVMDKDNIKIGDINYEIRATDGRTEATYNFESKGEWSLGDKLFEEFPIGNIDRWVDSVNVEIKTVLKIKGNRPYEFSDEVSSIQKHTIDTVQLLEIYGLKSHLA